MRRIVIFLLSFMFVLAPCNNQARIVETTEYCTTIGGCGYRSACSSACLVPAAGFALAILAAMIATGLHNRGHGHGHCH